MATLTLTYDTGSTPLSKINDAIALEYGYQATINGEANPETKAQFSKRMVGRIIKNIVKNQDLAAARQTAEAEVVEISLS